MGTTVTVDQVQAGMELVSDVVDAAVAIENFTNGRIFFVVGVPGETTVTGSLYAVANLSTIVELAPGASSTINATGVTGAKGIYLYDKNQMLIGSVDTLVPVAVVV